MAYSDTDGKKVVRIFLVYGCARAKTCLNGLNVQTFLDWLISSFGAFAEKHHIY